MRDQVDNAIPIWRERISSINADKNEILAGESVISYKHLVLAPEMEPDYSTIKGIFVG